jgi:hypothetical protein
MLNGGGKRQVRYAKGWCRRTTREVDSVGRSQGPNRLALLAPPCW